MPTPTRTTTILAHKRYQPNLEIDENHFQWTHDPVSFRTRDAHSTHRDWSSDGTVLEYSTRAPAIFDSLCRPNEKIVRTTRLFGVELEVCYKIEPDVGNIYRALPWSLVKYDGSVSNGYEIITAPATFAYHKHNWMAFFRKVKDSTRKPPAATHKGWSTQSCGMHVHVAKASLTPLVIGRALVFINDDRNTSFVTHIAGRELNHYCQKYSCKVKDGLVHPSPIRGSVNLGADGSQTIEFRIFKSNVREFGFFKNLEFVNELLNFATKTSDTSATRFVEWLRESKEPWNHPNLSRFLGLPAWEVSHQLKEAA